MKYLNCFLPLPQLACVCHAGMGGYYVLDEYGDRDANFSIIYTSAVTEKVVYRYFFFKFIFILFLLFPSSAQALEMGYDPNLSALLYHLMRKVP